MAKSESGSIATLRLLLHNYGIHMHTTLKMADWAMVIEACLHCEVAVGCTRLSAEPAVWIDGCLAAWLVGRHIFVIVGE